MGRPIVAGYDWILTPASIYIGNFFIKYYFKFENILTGSLELVRFIDKNTFHEDRMLFTMDKHPNKRCDKINQTTPVQIPKHNPERAFSD